MKSVYAIEALRMNGYPLHPAIVQENKIIGNNISLRNVSTEDAEFIISLRTEGQKGRFISATSSDISAQIKWIDSYLTGSGQAYFIIEDKFSNKLGTIRMYDQNEDSFCWGSWVIKDGAPPQTAIESAMMLYTYALKLGFNRAHFDVRKENLSVRRFHERFGAIMIKENDLDVFYEITKTSILNSMKKYHRFLPNGIRVE
ncbi:GNAT family N-acetyltransferase [Enterobacterales bacterium CwR94]|nr:GNAT family N-acetyltransferase [Enterobacterales bacterium CwR94]